MNLRRRVLLVKFGAPGDALRTTPLVRRLKADGAHVTWICDAPSREVVEAAGLADRLLVADETTAARLDDDAFDAVLSLDEDPLAVAIAARARAPEKRGLGRAEGGALVPLTPAAAYMVRLTRDDDLKFRENRKTVPEIQFEACGLSFAGERYAFELRDDDRAEARRALAGARAAGRPLVCLHVGCGRRWPTKAWTVDRFAALARALDAGGATAVVAAGPDERDLVEEVVWRAARRAVALPPLPVRAFAAALLGAEALVAADSLALHLALAVGRPVVGLFCATSAAEIEWYGLGEAVVAGGGPCYKARCVKWPGCMERITAEAVLEALGRHRRGAEGP